MKRILILLALLAFPVSASAGHPSFVVIMLDDANLAEVALALPKARALIADKGRAFDQYIVTQSLCSPSRSTFLTGMYPHNHHVVSNEYPDGGWSGFRKLGHEQQTFPLLLQRAGYQTALIGKYLNGYGGSTIPPGWTRWVGEQGGTLDQGYYFQINDQGVTRIYKPADGIYGDDLMANYAVSFLNATAGRPFLLYFAVSAPHPPNVPPRRYKNAFADVVAPRTPDFNEEDVTDKPVFIQMPLLTADEIAARDLLLEQELQTIRAVDDGVERIMATLTRLGRLANTFIMLTSDNGEWMDNHRLYRGKTLGYETDIHLPLWVRGPGVPLGHEARLVDNADFAPTILTLAGLTPPSWTDGRTFHRLLRGAEPAGGWRQTVPLERSPDSAMDRFGQPFHGVRTARYAFWQWGGGAEELYDLQVDPYELQNRAGDPTIADMQTALTALATQLASCVGNDCRIAERTGVP